MKKQLLILAGLVIFNTCFSQSNHVNNQVLGGGNSSALDFDGVDDKVTTPIIFNSTTYANWTIECWAKSPTGPSSALGFDGPMYGDNAGIIWHHGSGSFQGAGTVQAADLNYFSVSFGTLAPNTWYHLAVTYDGTLLKAYKNGNLMNTTTTSGGMANGAFPLVIGKHPTQGHHWQGTIDNPRVWTVARTCEQISETMNNVVISETGLLASYTFNEGVTNGSNTSLTAVQNSVTSTSDATLSGFALTGTSSNFVASAPFNLQPVCIVESASGLPANCLSFTAANDVVLVQNTVPLSDYTIECNVLLKDLANQNIIVGTDASGTNVSVSHQIKLVNGQFVHYTYDGNLRTLASTATVNINQWYHVSIFVQANNVMGITVNGITDYYPTAINTHLGSYYLNSDWVGLQWVLQILMVS
ncbi:MAG: laminin G domain-containing protein [Bacteroidetes bacterium]|nr:laminin G domain-containing protein [Bacteroidota bacterium]